MLVADVSLSEAALPPLTCRGLIELQGIEHDISFSLTISAHFRLSFTELFLLIFTVCVCVCA